MGTLQLSDFISSTNLDSGTVEIIDKILHNKRLSPDEGVKLFKLDLGLLALLANHIKEKKNNNYVFFNKNIHIEPTNICVYNCKFCSYHRKTGEEGAWEYSINDIIEKITPYKNSNITEIHIVGGVHPDRDIHYYGDMISEVKKIIPNIHIKAFTAVELDFMIKKAGLNPEEGLKLLKDKYGLDSIPGGGAEIFNDEIRKKVCHEKSSSEKWITIHETAHRVGLPSNATMLYGHLETFEHRIHHLSILRDLQDKTNGFNTFIPLKYKKANNQLAHLGEVSMLEDMKCYAVSRIFLDNFGHIKAYWPMIGKQSAQVSLSFGVDDIDGTIDDSTKIYTMAGSVEQKPSLTTNEIIKLIKSTGRIPVERDTLYNHIKKYN